MATNPTGPRLVGKRGVELIKSLEKIDKAKALGVQWYLTSNQLAVGLLPDGTKLIGRDEDELTRQLNLLEDRR